MKKKSYPWADRLIEIALKSILELNIEFAIMSTDDNSRMDSNNIEITKAKSFQHIDERQFCSKILLNSLNSYLFAGSMQKEDKDRGIKKGLRFWKFYSDLEYKHTRNYCDIIMDRVLFDGEHFREHKKPVYIEAKKAKLEKIIDYDKGEIKAVDNYNYHDCKDDIKKLINEMEYMDHNKEFDCIYCHLLIWGDTIDLKNDNPEKVEKYLKDKIFENHKGYDINIHQIRWFPLDSLSEINISDNYKIKKWGWVVLMEIEKNA